MTAAWKPVPKVVAAGVGGALATVLLWVLTAVTAVDVPTPVTAAVTTLLAFAAGYLKTPAEHGDSGQSALGFAVALSGLAVLVLLGLGFAAAARL